MKQITAKQYAKIRPFLPVQRGNVRIPNIAIINAVLYVLENGCKRRALPERFGKWQTVYARFRRWSRSCSPRFETCMRPAGTRSASASTALASRCIPTAPERRRRTGRKALASRAADGTRRSTWAPQAAGNDFPPVRRRGQRRARRPRPAGELGRSGRERASGDGPRLRRRQDPPARPRPRDDAGRAASRRSQSRHSWPPVASKQTKAVLSKAMRSSSAWLASVFGRRSWRLSLKQ